MLDIRIPDEILNFQIPDEILNFKISDEILNLQIPDDVLNLRINDALYDFRKTFGEINLVNYKKNFDAIDSFLINNSSTSNKNYDEENNNKESTFDAIDSFLINNSSTSNKNYDEENNNKESTEINSSVFLDKKYVVPSVVKKGVDTNNFENIEKETGKIPVRINNEDTTVSEYMSSSNTNVDNLIDKNVDEAYNLFIEVLNKYKAGQFFEYSGNSPIENCLLKISVHFGFHTLGSVVLKLFYDYWDDESILIDVGRSLIGFNYNNIYFFAYFIVKDLLRNPSDDLKEVGVELIDNWNNTELIRRLKSIEVKTKWIQDYIDNVIANSGVNV